MPTQFGTSDALTRKLWAKKAFYERLKETVIGQYIGNDENNIIINQEETSKSFGDKVTTRLYGIPSGHGRVQRQTLEGNEENLIVWSDSYYIDFQRHALDLGMPMDMQRVGDDFWEVGNKLIKLWADNRFETVLAGHLCGYTPQNYTTETSDDGRALKYNGFNTITAPTSGRIVRAGAVANDESLGTTNTFSLTLIDDVMTRVKTSKPKVPLVRVGGMPKGIVFLHPDQMYDLRQDTRWTNIQLAAIQGGDRTGSNLYKYAAGEYADCILVEWPYITYGVHSSTGAAVANTRRAVFCGAQAAAIAFGKAYSDGMWQLNDYTTDAGDRRAIKVAMIWGANKLQYNSKDYGAYVISTYATDRSEQ